MLTITVLLKCHMKDRQDSFMAYSCVCVCVGVEGF